MPERRADADSTPRPGRRSWACGGLVGLLALGVFGYDLPAEPHFADESAFLSQSYYADLWLDGHRDDPAWFDYPAIDLPPLPKYAIGGALRAEGYPRLGPEAARRWY